MTRKAKSKSEHEEELIIYTQEELDLYQPDITKSMRGLHVVEKKYILRECMEEYFENLKNKEVVNG